MTSGHYKLRLSSDLWKTMRVEIPKNCKSNYCKLGTIVVESVDPPSETSQDLMPKASVPDQPISGIITGTKENLRSEPPLRASVPVQMISGIISGSKVNLRSGPSLKASVLQRIEDKGTGVQTLDKHGDWYKVKTLVFEGWMFKKYIRLRQYQVPDGKWQ